MLHLGFCRGGGFILFSIAIISLFVYTAENSFFFLHLFFQHRPSSKRSPTIDLPSPKILKPSDQNVRLARHPLLRPQIHVPARVGSFSSFLVCFLRVSSGLFSLFVWCDCLGYILIVCSSFKEKYLFGKLGFASTQHSFRF